MVALCHTKALVCSDLDDQINIGITVMKISEMSIQYSASGPAFFSFANGEKQAVAKIESIPKCEDREYYNFSRCSKKKLPLFVTMTTWIHPLSNLYVNVNSKEKHPPFAMKVLRCEGDTQIKYLPGPVPTYYAPNTTQIRFINPSDRGRIIEKN